MSLKALTKYISAAAIPYTLAVSTKLMMMHISSIVLVLVDEEDIKMQGSCDLPQHSLTDVPVEPNNDKKRLTFKYSTVVISIPIPSLLPRPYGRGQTP
jgi:hypothetical protein